MTTSELFDAGRLEEAITLAGTELRDDPLNPGKRWFLVELLSLAGNWDRALTVLRGANDTGGNAAHYERLLRAEAKRRAFLVGQGRPKILGDTTPLVEEHLALHMDAIVAYEQGDETRAIALLSQAMERASYDDLRDADDRFAPVLEVLDGDDYAWLPFSSVRSLQISKPGSPFDFVFTPVTADIGKGLRRLFVAGRYPGTEKATDVALRLSRKTTSVPSEATICLGQRVFLRTNDPVPLFELNRWENSPVRNSVAMT